MNIPTFINQPWIKENFYLTNPVEMYNDELNQAMQNGLSDNGWTVPQLKSADIVKISSEMPDGTLWYATDATPPCYVGKISNVLVKFTTTAFP
jgi:hypothetical protein